MLLSVFNLTYRRSSATGSHSSVVCLDYCIQSHLVKNSSKHNQLFLQGLVDVLVFIGDWNVNKVRIIDRGLMSF